MDLFPLSESEQKPCSISRPAISVPLPVLVCPAGSERYAAMAAISEPLPDLVCPMGSERYAAMTRPGKTSQAERRNSGASERRREGCLRRAYREQTTPMGS